jgi:hypothetical protein
MADIPEDELQDIHDIEDKLLTLYTELRTKYPKLREVVVLGGYGKGVFCVSPSETIEQISDFVGKMAIAMKTRSPRYRGTAVVNPETGKVELRTELKDVDVPFLVVNPHTEPN